MIHVTAAQARAHGLPELDFCVDLTGTPLQARLFPEPDKYLLASGPPGGPLLAIAWPSELREAHVGTVEHLVRRHFSQPWQQPLVIGAPATIVLGPTGRVALGFVTGEAMRRTAWCGAIASGPRGSVLITLGRAAGPGTSPSCNEVLAEPSLAAFARTFAFVA